MRPGLESGLCFLMLLEDIDPDIELSDSDSDCCTEEDMIPYPSYPE